VALIIRKYGGSSLSSPKLIKNVARNLVDEKGRGNQVVVVVSAMGETTDHLIEMAEEICEHPPKREMDMLLSVGERISIALLAMAIHNLGHEAISFTGSQVGIITDAKHTEARILEVRATRLLEELKKNRIVIVAGFQGVSITREITTLGRGGSDSTAIALAAALKADRCEIMKDVDGVFVAEPKLIPGVGLNKEISYQEMIEMADMGAGVMQTESIELARTHRIKVAVGSSFSGKVGTIITNRSLESAGISGIVGRKNMVYLRVQAKQNEAINHISRELVKARIRMQAYLVRAQLLEMVFPKENKGDVVQILERVQNNDFELSPVFEEGKGIIAIIGSGLNFNSELSLKIFETLETLKLPVEMLQISQLRVSWMTDEGRVDQIVTDLHGCLKPKKN
jgi:aspartate kinase